MAACTSVTMYKGSKDLLDYSATKGAITAFTVTPVPFSSAWSASVKASTKALVAP